MHACTYVPILHTSTYTCACACICILLRSQSEFVFVFDILEYILSVTPIERIRMLAVEVLRIVRKSNNGEARYDAIIVLEDLIFSPKLGAKYFLSRALFCKQAKNKKRNQLSPIQFFYCFCC